MFGLSLTKILVLGLAIYGAWQLFRWIERRSANQVAPPAQPPEAPAKEEDGAVEMEQDPNTGVWRPKHQD
tara:strand:+ start:1237 stop:1446 length:210 start_codon:yes stop_codon:yes gene_type:complete